MAFSGFARSRGMGDRAREERDRQHKAEQANFHLVISIR
jgi:hypothetical protein